MMHAACNVCDGPLVRGIADWHFVCRACGLAHSAFAPAINARQAAIVPDEHARSSGLAPLRDAGYRRVLDALRATRGGGRGGTLLEVGSAHGWFLRAAAPDFDRSVGIEPDDGVRWMSNDARIEVRAGYFPEQLGAAERFDAIAFNDVLEHIPDARRTAAAVADALRPGGIAIISIPVADGAIYRGAALMYRAGIRGPFERLWQKDFPSPHLYYFPRAALVRLFEHAGFACVRTLTMPTLRVTGLWSRIRYAEPRIAVAAVTYAAAVLAAPALRALPADVMCFFFRKSG